MKHLGLFGPKALALLLYDNLLTSWSYFPPMLSIVCLTWIVQSRKQQQICASSLPMPVNDIVTFSDTWHCYSEWHFLFLVVHRDSS